MLAGDKFSNVLCPFRNLKDGVVFALLGSLAHQSAEGPFGALQDDKGIEDRRHNLHV